MCRIMSEGSCSCPDCQSAGSCNLTNCADILLKKFDCKCVDSCNGTNGPPCKEDKSPDVLIIVVPVVCSTVIILLIIITVMFSLYWKFKIKVIREA